VVEGLVLSDNNNQAEVTAFKILSFQWQAIFIQVASSDILEKMVESESTHEMWILLGTKYYRNTAYVFVNQITCLILLLTKYTTSDSLASFISSFKTKWLKLQKLA
jgi:hypothetical protein